MDSVSEQQRVGFSQRFSAELVRLGLAVGSPTQIARAFNQKFSGKPVTAQSVRKWLLAETMPTQPKLLALAAWFGVSAQWLRFGTGSRVETATGTTAEPPPGLLVLGEEHSGLIQVVEMLAKLSPRDRQLVSGMIRLLLEAPGDAA